MTYPPNVFWPHLLDSFRFASYREAGVISFKTHMRKISHAQSFTHEKFSTMLTRIEACLNSLISMTDNPSDV